MVRIIDIDYLNKISIVCKSLLDAYLTNDFNKSSLTNAYILFYLSIGSQESINKDKLVRWADSYFKEKIKSKKFTKEKDKEITAIFLIYKALNLQSYKNELIDLYNTHIDREGIFFKNLSYSAMIQYSSFDLKNKIENFDENTNSLTKKYLAQKHFNNTLGLQFLCMLNKGVDLIGKIKETLNDPSENYESRLYLALSLYLSKKSKTIDPEMHEILSTIDTPPAVLADVVNDGDISNYSRPAVNSILMKISPFYVASLDYLTNLLRNDRLDVLSETYKQKGMFNRAFGWIVGSLSLILFLLILEKYVLSAFYDGYLLNLKFFWIVPEYLIVLVIYTAIIDLGIKGYSEAIIMKSFLKRLKSWSKWFFVALIFLGIIIGIISNRLSNWPLFRK